ncbi:hypothetical protein sos41_10400 [Alphaproteobacteria bacterium SO-S41]|nr:hypothetical protein sos41_10400 [Alphaproteobacteria bacterium SO-S41]
MRTLIGLTICLALASTATAGPAADKAAEHLYAGTLAAGEAELQSLSAASPDNVEAIAGLGAIQFTRAIERFAQDMYRHGLQPGGGAYGPLLRLPIPVNPAPEKLTYEELRAIFEHLSTDLDLAEVTLSRVGERAVKLPLATGRIRIDVNGDGKADETEQLIALAFGDSAPTEFKAQNESFVVAFDTADIYWLRGYSNLLASVADFWLAFDFRETFDLTFHVIFPKAGLPNSATLTTGSQIAGMEADSIADFIALIHLIDWPVADRARLTGLASRGLAIIDLNRKTWASAMAETDDDREWLPAPGQKSGVMAGMEVTKERIDAWLGALGEAEAVLNGTKLVGHWRFAKGFNLKRVLAEMDHFDLVLWVTGHAALPYLEDGTIADGAAFQQADRVFSGDLLTYAFWFN